MGVCAHALDELHGRPLRTRFSDRALWVAAIASGAGAIGIGIGGIVTVSVWLAPLVAIGALLLPAYNLELAGGRFHSDMWFAAGWGAFPAFTGYFVCALRVDATGILIAGGCMAMSLAQRHLSSAARDLTAPDRRGGGRAETDRRQLRAAHAAAAARPSRPGACDDVSDRGAARGGVAGGATLSGASGRLVRGGACRFRASPARDSRQPASACAPGPGATAVVPSGSGVRGSNRPSTEPPKPPPIRRAPAAPAASSAETVASTAGVETA